MREKFSIFHDKNILLAWLAGLFLALSRLDWQLGFLAFFSFIPLFLLFRQVHKTRALILSALTFSTTYTLLALHWISLVTIGGFLGLFVLFGVYFSLLFAAINLVRKYAPKYTNLALITFWMIFEYLQNFTEFRFPWFNLGYSLAEYETLIQVADLGGVYLVSILTLLASYLLFRVLFISKKSIFFLLGLALLWWGYGYYRMQTISLETSTENISLVQASIPQTAKWDPAAADSTLADYQRLTAEAAAQNPALIIWPESALPDYLLQRNSKFSRFLRKQTAQHQIDIFSGVPRYQFAPPEHSEKYQFFNSATLFHPDGSFAEPYDKMFLVPFGERIPFLDIFPILWNIQLGQANFSYGEKPHYYQLGSYTYSPLICFEIAFPYLTRQIMQQPVDFVVNLTNDAWFKRSVGTYQHAMLTKFRAVEIRRTIFRAANTGYSLVVDPLGKISASTKLFAKTTLTHPIIISQEISFFTKYFTLFPLACTVLALYIIIMVIYGRIKK
ncbi:MAG: apolipoprotein N-acyltransferase [Candidatus Cloacimonadales bacterium]